MAEFEDKLPDWQRQVESAVFYPGRKGDINTSGNQFTVYTIPGIDYVVKVPLLERWLSGYTHVKVSAPELGVPFALARDLKLNINRIKTVIPEAIVQSKVDDLLIEIQNIYITKDFERYSRMVEGYFEADSKLFGAGLFVPDPSLMNFGIDRHGEIRTLDLGSVRREFGDDEEYSSLARARGHTHFSTYLAFQEIEKNLGTPPDNTCLPSEKYFQLMNFPPQHEKGSNLDDIITNQSGRRWDPDLSMCLAIIGHQEFVNHAPDGAPFEINEQFIRGLPESLRAKDGPNFF